MSADGLKASVEKMEAEGIPKAAIDTFRHYYEQLESGETGMVPEDSIEPADDVTESTSSRRRKARWTARSCSSSTAASARAWA